ncbi:alanine--tRNA ligase [Zavarzinella formosa]|uniref:alanine--tRNA ligase n=1 Tax=Zavarzinella formosa TaxID=360055 RepID=UPI00031C9529|nr:alanine--tRNA ligase [Zavarzinella formosa]
MLSANEIRQQFIDFFVQKHAHTFVPSSSVVPLDDKTLMFANAGMNQFKPIFLGLEKRAYTRAVNTQKCIRAGGKHNDLDDVGKDTYHHTFFEMLGNWSFGDYFKKEAIAWAWELLTVVWKLDPERLHVTVFEGDKENNVPEDIEAAGYWEAVGVPKSRIHRGNKKDNFWEMGDTGPCGPCTEIHYDATPDKSGAKLVNQSSDQVVEIWNNVFIQFNRNPDKSLTPLPAQHVDTGMGFERITKVIQGKTSNYDTDIFIPLMTAIQEVTKAPAYGAKLEDRKDTAYRVIADHIRTLTFSITDGGVPSNEGRGSVIRSILRRAALFGWLDFGMREPFVHLLVPAVVANFGEAFPELKRDPKKVAAVILDEEKSFLRTIERGLKLYQTAAEKAQKAGGVISAKEAFDLHTEQGFFIDITAKLAADGGLTVDRAGYDKLFEQFKIDSDKGRKTIIVTAVKGDLPKTDDSPKYVPGPVSAKVLGWVSDNTVINTGTLAVGDEVGLLLNRTNFYGEQGGQAGDRGVIEVGEFTFEVEGTQRLGDAVLHIGAVTSGEVSVGDVVTALPGTERIDIMRNHTATHMMNLALREVVGDHIDQKGSLVDAEKLRFDFSHDKPLTTAEIAEIEAQVNRDIREDLPVSATIVPLAEAKKLPGVRAMFGEKYPDPVRVVAIGTSDLANADDGMSIEFCGGTHLNRTSQAGFFKIVSQENVSKGVRRVTAVTGRKAFDYVQEMATVLSDLTSKFSCSVEELPKRIETLQEDVKKLQKTIQKGTAGDLNTVGDTLVAKAAEINGVKLVVGEVPGVPVETLRAQMDRLRQKAGSAVIVLGWKNEDETAGLMVGVSEDVIKKGVKSNDILKPVAEVIGGKGGGPPHLATAGGKDATKLADALAKAGELAKTLLQK